MSSELAVRPANEVAFRPNYPANRQQQRETIVIRDAQVTYRNFAGKPGPYNEEGERSFSVVLDEALGQLFIDRGLNVKPMRKRDEDEEQMYTLPVAVSYRHRPPRVYMVTGDGDTLPLRKTLMSEDVLHMMDGLELGFCQMVIVISNYEVRGTKGKKAYLQSFFGHVIMDELEQEYATVEDMIGDDTEVHRETDNVIEGEVVY
jgi:hypothetical protein